MGVLCDVAQTRRAIKGATLTMKKSKIYLASDHAGFEMKNNLRDFLVSEGYMVEDCGAYQLRNDDDYPEILGPAMHALASDVRAGMLAKGIILGGSGQGEAMLANKFRDIRAAVYYGGDEKIITLSREHNDANVLSLGARFLTNEKARAAVLLWLQREFSDEKRHVRRIAEMRDVRRMDP